VPYYGASIVHRKNIKYIFAVCTIVWVEKQWSRTQKKLLFCLLAENIKTKYFQIPAVPVRLHVGRVRDLGGVELPEVLRAQTQSRRNRLRNYCHDGIRTLSGKKQQLLKSTF
jgi:hypothetical protein